MLGALNYNLQPLRQTSENKNGSNLNKQKQQNLIYRVITDAFIPRLLQNAVCICLCYETCQSALKQHARQFSK